MSDYEIIFRKPTVKELNKLKQEVKWGEVEEKALEVALKNSLFGICICEEERVIATARVVGDGVTCFYIQDVIVHPSYQGKGLGIKVMNGVMEYISVNACKGAVVGLMSAKGKESFYEKFGFWKRPNENYGCGMVQFWGK